MMNAEQRTQLVDAVTAAKEKIQRIEAAAIGVKGGMPWHDRLDLVREQGRVDGIGHAVETLTDDEEQWFLIEREAERLASGEVVAS